MSDFDQTYVSNGSKVIPSSAINVRITVSGGSGGNGGTDSNPGGVGGGGRRATLLFPDFTGRAVAWIIGYRGSNGFGCVSGSGSGSGGSGAAVGGNGGNTGPEGCSGGGGGGGGATVLSDNVAGGLVAILGGGGGGGGGSHPDSFLRGGNGGPALGMLTGNGSLTGGFAGASQGYDGAGGGGGGAGSPGGNGGREGADDRAGGYPSFGGNGGSSWYNSTYVGFTENSGSQNFGNGSVEIKYDIASPVIDSFTADQTPIIRGALVLLQWETSYVSSVSLSNSGGTSFNVDDNYLVSPTTTTTYRLTATGLDGVTSIFREVTIVVYIPPVLYLNISPSSIVAGQSATLSWYITGDGNTMTWLTGGITNTNVTSSEVVAPIVSTTYSGRVSGLGGTSPIASITLVVYQYPLLDVDYPTSINYGTQGTIEYTATYTNTALTLTPTYYYLDGVTVVGDSVELSRPNSAEAGVGITEVTSTYDTTIPYTNRGPLSVSYFIQGTGNGGLVSSSDTVAINIDDTPDNLNPPDSDDLIADQEPVITPETDVLSENLLVDDIDIDVEIKSNFPIQVQINGDGTWENVREL